MAVAEHLIYSQVIPRDYPRGLGGFSLILVFRPEAHTTGEGGGAPLSFFLGGGLSGFHNDRKWSTRALEGDYLEAPQANPSRVAKVTAGALGKEVKGG